LGFRVYRVWGLPNTRMRSARRFKTCMIAGKDAKIVAIKFLTVGEFFCNGRMTLTIRTVLKPPREIPFGSTSMIITTMKQKSSRFHPPSSVPRIEGLGFRV